MADFVGHENQGQEVIPARAPAPTPTPTLAPEGDLLTHAEGNGRGEPESEPFSSLQALHSGLALHARRIRTCESSLTKFVRDVQDSNITLSLHDLSSARYTLRNAQLDTTALKQVLSSVCRLEPVLDEHKDAEASECVMNDPSWAAFVDSVRAVQQDTRIITDQVMSYIRTHTAADPPSVPDRVCVGDEEAYDIFLQLLGDTALTRTQWSECPLNGGSSLNVRGKTYMQDSVKVPSMAPVFMCVGVQVLGFRQREDDCVNRLNLCPLLHLPPSLQSRTFLLLNWQIPGVPVVQVLVYYMLRSTAEALCDLRARGDDDGADSPNSNLSPETQASTQRNHISPHKPVKETRRGRFSRSSKDMSPELTQPTGHEWAHLLRWFWNERDEFKDERLKLIPRIVEGSWTLKHAVGTKPAILGKKLKHRYFRGANYVEVDIDLGSSSVASAILSMVRDLSRTITVDMAVTVQGEESAELPERITCCVRFAGVDLSAAVMADSHINTRTTAPREAP